MSESENKTILVTGGSGFIGSVTCTILKESGFNVINLDRTKRQLDGITQYPFDIDNHQLKGLIDVVRPEAVIHLAANHSVPESISDPAGTYYNNVANSVSLLKQCIDSGVKHVVFSSSSSVYGNSDYLLNSEIDPTDPLTPYGRSKLMIENVLEDFSNAYDFSYTALRYFNAAGSYNGLGYQLDPKSHILPILVEKALKDETFTINGDDFDTPDGTCMIDYTHVVDIAMAHMSALNYLFDGGKSGAFNIGGGSSNSIKDLVAEVGKQLGKEVKVEIGPRRDGDPAKTSANIAKAFDEMGWESSLTIEDIIRDEIQYQKAVLKL
jgi:UDP-glucose-4-epimerase GalE